MAVHDYYLESAKRLLENRSLVLCVLSGFERRASSEDAAAHFAEQYPQLGPLLRHVLENGLPTDEQLSAPRCGLDTDPLYLGVHKVLTNCAPIVPRVLQRYPELATASDERFLETVNRLWAKWAETNERWDGQQSKLVPALERFLIRLDAATEHGAKSGCASTRSHLLREYFNEMVHPLRSTSDFWGDKIFCPRWYQCTSTSKFDGVEIVHHGDRLTITIRINSR